MQTTTPGNTGYKIYKWGQCYTEQSSITTCNMLYRPLKTKNPPNNVNAQILLPFKEIPVMW